MIIVVVYSSIVHQTNMQFMIIVVVFVYSSTIRRHEEEAKKTLGDRLYADLDQMIYDLMDGGRYQAMAEKTAGPQVHGGSVEREGALNREQKENRLKLPPYRGRYFHEIFNDGRWGYR